MTRPRQSVAAADRRRCATRAQITRPATTTIPTATQTHTQGDPELPVAAGVVAAPAVVGAAVVGAAVVGGAVVGGVVGGAVVGGAVVGGAVVGGAVVGGAVVGGAVVGCPVPPVLVAVTLAATLLTAELTLLPAAPHAASGSTMKTIRPTSPAYFLSICGSSFRAQGKTPSRVRGTGPPAGHPARVNC